MEIKAIVTDITKIKTEALIINHYEGEGLAGDAAAIDKALGGAISQLIQQGEIKGKLNEITLIHSLGKLPAVRVVVAGLGKSAEVTTNKVRGAVAEACRRLRDKGVTNIATELQGAGRNNITPADAAQAITEGARLGLYTFRKHITRKDNGKGEIKELYIIAGEDNLPQLETAIRQGNVLCEAANLARDMVNEPANVMTPQQMADVAVDLSRRYGLEVTVLEREHMKKLGMGALLGVAQGSEQPPKFIVLTYRGNPTGQVDVALVGKGITFDSGGISIKPSDHMDEMKGDMAGGAAVMAALGAIAQLKPKINVTAIVPATENLPSGSALKPGDILTAMNGKTIEIISTDAEGRLILADALSYSVKELSAKLIIDVATLTGACVVALGHVCSGGFTNNQELVNKVIASGTATGELIWQLPMFEEYNELNKSDVADIKNAGNRWAGAISAAKFLAEFVGETPWVHLDIAGTNMSEKEKGYLVKGGTGVPVRTLVNFVLGLAK